MTSEEMDAYDRMVDRHQHEVLDRQLTQIEKDLEIERLKDALHRDRTGLAMALAQVVQAARSRAWLMESRGPYEWDDDRYKDEAGEAIREVIEIAEKALSDSGSLAHKALTIPGYR